MNLVWCINVCWAFLPGVLGQTPTPTRSPTITLTPTRSPTISVTPTRSPTISLTPTTSLSLSPTASMSRSLFSIVTLIADFMPPCLFTLHVNGDGYGDIYVCTANQYAQTYPRVELRSMGRVFDMYQNARYRLLVDHEKNNGANAPNLFYLRESTSMDTLHINVQLAPGNSRKTSQFDFVYTGPTRLGATWYLCELGLEAYLDTANNIYDMTLYSLT
eukprot:gb/GEZN01012891.1/.p1 GENE.gb/GEZN01012891.1/~~gb/GEZN01012891.1/.p1  ORF type:complete len:217 (-),score=1.17 gb/GEZN01012891.1/:354-1004(-)